MTEPVRPKPNRQFLNGDDTPVRARNVPQERLRFAFVPGKGGKRPGFTDSTGEYRDTRIGWLGKRSVLDAVREDSSGWPASRRFPGRVTAPCSLAPILVATAHQAHGAIGFTHERRRAARRRAGLSFHTIPEVNRGVL